MSLSISSRFYFEASILFQVDLFLRHYGFRVTRKNLSSRIFEDRDLGKNQALPEVVRAKSEAGY
ncbi:hypothetical protein DU53_07875 [Kosmotoga sp. DU53]|uniref:Uncharacterized protein n=1 Tax=Kosmotoga olearia (strain ATCC BAA-1733 / DSM 21960 / TBF 19.5.1) TaxID=521045 RepID=C5CE15_KOSOT|nr:hypothetical protein Kole_1424 [Kosmotoga olearia TBF 19.5.1]OAA20308.1 hypothetical protein DU53_07875 [Kosmotoga sp. DU53]